MVSIIKFLLLLSYAFISYRLLTIPVFISPEEDFSDDIQE